GNCAIRRATADPQLGAVPRHVGVTPFEPREQRIVRTEARSGIEIVARNQRPWRSRSIERYVDERIDRLARAGLVILAHPHHAAPYAINHAVCVAPASGLGGGVADWGGLPGALLAVHALVGVVAKIDDAIANQICAAAIF